MVKESILNANALASQHLRNSICLQSMDISNSNSNRRRLRLLVVIASYGRKNEPFLRRIIQKYQSMAMNVDVVVMSESPKDLGSGVRVLVGLPSKNPWSLPFGHKKIFAENLERYDLFAYSEDDMEVTEQHIQAFLRVTSELADNEIAGFIRYEIGPSGTWSMPEAHGVHHWKPESITRRNGYVTGEFTNEHAAFYLLTQAQLRKVIASGGFLRDPCEGRYDMACTAATDPYTICGFRKVICISALEDFLIHHLPNRYAGQLGLPFSAFKEQVQTLVDIVDGKHPASTLCEVESKILHGRWSKKYDEEPCAELLSMVPSKVQTLLSIGCGSGAIESRFIKRGIAVAALPLDSVVGASAVRLGIEVIYGSWEEGIKQLSGRKFDCVVVTNLLHLRSDPELALEQCARLVTIGGTLIIIGPNFNRLTILTKRILGLGYYRKLWSFDQSGIHTCGPGIIKKHLRHIGFRLDAIRWLHEPSARAGLTAYKRRLGKFTAEEWILRTRRKELPTSLMSV